MGRIVVTEYISLDGVIEAPGGGEDYKHQGWTFDVERGQEGDKFKLDETLEAEAQLLGRVTYEGFAAAWPTMTEVPGLEELAEKFNSMPKFVFSSTLEQADWNNSTILSGDFAEEIGKLKQQVDGIILVGGSAQLVQGLVEHDLVDEIRLMVFPLMLGSGKRLFAEHSDKKPLRLVDSKTVGAGIAVLTYEPV
jgi:dihydrofolate reductase